MKRQFILLKDSPELKKGTILIENEDGLFTTEEGYKFEDQRCTVFTTYTVTKNPEWFQEIVLIPVLKTQETKVKEFVNSLNKGRKLLTTTHQNENRKPASKI